MKNKYLLLSLLLFAIIVVINQHYHLYHIPQKNKIHTSGDVKILTFNIGSPDSTRFCNEIADSIFSVINKTNADIICFQELSFNNLRQIKPQLDSIFGTCDVLKGDDQMWRLLFYSNFPLKNYKRYHCEGRIDTCGFDQETKNEISLLRLQMPIQSADFEVSPGKWIRVFSGHLRSNAYSTARRSMNENSNWVKGIPLYYHNYKIGKTIRDFEAKNVRRIIDEALSENIPIVLAGDLNDWYGSKCLSVIQGSKSNKMRDSWWVCGKGFGMTFCGRNLRLRIDHILVSDKIDVVDAQIIKTNISDHRPLLVELKVNE